MAVPTYDKLMLPLLQFAGDGVEHHIQDAVVAIADALQLSEEEFNELLPSGKKRKFSDRVHWANTYLKKANLLKGTRRGYFRITELGLDVLHQNPSDIDKDFLMQFEEFVDFVTPSTNEDDSPNEHESVFVESKQTPDELIKSVHQSLLRQLSDELLEYVLASSPEFFEQLVVDLLLAMGYGGTLQDAGKTIGKSGDGGLDGYIQEDKLGLDIIYLQAKRWNENNSIGRPEIQAFVGSLIGRGATKGVFITTSSFSAPAREYAENMQTHKIVLIDGKQLTQLMIEHDVGVSVEANYVVKRVDRDFFEVE